MRHPDKELSFPAYQVQARNFSSEVENRIHNDDLAGRLGFKGALVPGVAVYGHMTHPLVELHGERWLSQANTSVRFLKPAYDGDELAITLTRSDDGYDVQCRARDELLATLHTSIAKTSLEPGDIAADAMSIEIDSGERVEISRDSILLGKRFPDRVWTPTPSENQTYREQVLDGLPIYNDGWVHPHLLLSQANTCLTHRYEMPAWIHVGSEVQAYQGLRVNEDVTISAQPTRVWERKGHEFVELAIHYTSGTELLMAIKHTAIYRIAGMG